MLMCFFCYSNSFSSLVFLYSLYCYSRLDVKAFTFCLFIFPKLMILCSFQPLLYQQSKPKKSMKPRMKKP